MPRELVDDCLRLAIQAPSGSNRQDRAFVVVDDLETKGRLAELYRRGMAVYATGRSFAWPPGDVRWTSLERIAPSAQHLVDHFHEVPLMVIPCVERRPEPGSPWTQASADAAIIPAARSFMLACRSRGIGTCWTSVHLHVEAEARELLGIPPHVTQVGLLVAGWFTGDTFRPARRRPLDEVVHRNRWGVS